MIDIIVYWGSKGIYFENMCIVFREVVCVGVEGIELDVYFFKDGYLIVMYDEMVDCIIDGYGEI